MRRSSEPHTFDERLNAEKARIEAALEGTDPGPQRDLLELKLRQVETALHRCQNDRRVLPSGSAGCTSPR